MILKIPVVLYHFFIDPTKKLTLTAQVKKNQKTKIKSSSLFTFLYDTYPNSAFERVKALNPYLLETVLYLLTKSKAGIKKNPLFSKSIQNLLANFKT